MDLIKKTWFEVMLDEIKAKENAELQIDNMEMGIDVTKQQTPDLDLIADLAHDELKINGPSYGRHKRVHTEDGIEYLEDN